MALQPRTKPTTSTPTDGGAFILPSKKLLPHPNLQNPQSCEQERHPAQTSATVGHCRDVAEMAAKRLFEGRVLAALKEAGRAAGGETSEALCPVSERAVRTANSDACVQFAAIDPPNSKGKLAKRQMFVL